MRWLNWSSIDLFGKDEHCVSEDCHYGGRDGHGHGDGDDRGDGHDRGPGCGAAHCC